MPYAILYACTAVVFLALDALGLRFLLLPLFESHIGELLQRPARLGPAAAFYLFYVVGVVWFAGRPALRQGRASAAFLPGAFLGALCYGTYEFTNYATLAAWHWQLVAVDLAWGTALTGTTAALGVALALRLGARARPAN
jgi:uncharacterized membrane protein